MTLAAIREGLATTLEATGIERIYTEDPDDITPPCIVIGNPTGSYDDTFEGGYSPRFPVVVVVSRTPNSTRAIETLDTYVDPTSSLSVTAAVRGDTNLGGACMSAAVIQWDSYDAQAYSWGVDEYAGVTFLIEIVA